MDSKSRLGLLLLAYELYKVGLGNIPPVTLAVLGLNVYLYLFPAAPLWQVCMSVERVYWYKEWRRLVLSPLHHANVLHLSLNMVSFLREGIRLERRLGRAWFLYLLSVFSLLTGIVYLLLETGLTEVTGHSMYCAVGFSGVLFALKMLNNHYHPEGVTLPVFDFPVSNRYAIWVELVLMQIVEPRTSLIGHLAGILVGYLYTVEPLKAIMKICKGQTSQRGAPPPYGFRESGEAIDEEIRQRRLRRFDR